MVHVWARSLLEFTEESESSEAQKVIRKMAFITIKTHCKCGHSLHRLPSSFFLFHHIDAFGLQRHCEDGLQQHKKSFQALSLPPSLLDFPFYLGDSEVTGIHAKAWKPEAWYIFSEEIKSALFYPSIRETHSFLANRREGQGGFEKKKIFAAFIVFEQYITHRGVCEKSYIGRGRVPGSTLDSSHQGLQNSSHLGLQVKLATGQIAHRSTLDSSHWGLHLTHLDLGLQVQHERAKATTGTHCSLHWTDHTRAVN